MCFSLTKEIEIKSALDTLKNLKKAKYADGGLSDAGSLYRSKVSFGFKVYLSWLAGKLLSGGGM